MKQNLQGVDKEGAKNPTKRNHPAIELFPRGITACTKSARRPRHARMKGVCCPGNPEAALVRRALPAEDVSCCEARSTTPETVFVDVSISPSLSLSASVAPARTTRPLPSIPDGFRGPFRQLCCSGRPMVPAFCTCYGWNVAPISTVEQEHIDMKAMHISFRELKQTAGVSL